MLRRRDVIAARPIFKPLRSYFFQSLLLRLEGVNSVYAPWKRERSIYGWQWADYGPQASLASPNLAVHREAPNMRPGQLANQD